MILIEETDFVELRWFDYATWDWTIWFRFESTEKAQTHAILNLSRGTQYEIQSIRSRRFTA